LTATDAAGVRVDAGPISDEQSRDVLLALHPAGGRPRGDGWSRCEFHRSAIERSLNDGLRLTKIRKLLVRQGVAISYPTLHRFAVLELHFGADRHDDSGRRTGGPRAAGRYGMGRVAHAVPDPAHPTALSRLDFYRRAIALSIRVSDVRRKDGPRD